MNEGLQEKKKENYSNITQNKKYFTIVFDFGIV